MAPSGERAEGEASTGNAKKQSRRALFVAEYLIDLNGRKAAIRAGFAERSAHVTASRLLKDPRVKKAIDLELKERRARLRVSADRVEKELAKIGFANLLDYTQPDGSIDLKRVSRDQAAAILEVRVQKVEMAGPELDKPIEPPGSNEPSGEVEERLEPQPHGGALKRSNVVSPGSVVTTTKLKLHPKITALELLGKRLKMFSEKVEHTGKVTLVVDQ